MIFSMRYGKYIIMDSINKNQPEENYKALQGEEAVKKIIELTDKAKTCFFCTKPLQGDITATRPMSVQKVDEEGNLWFLSAKDSHKNEELQASPHAHLLFQGSSYSDFLTIYGPATVTTDKAKIKELWEPTLKTWFTEGIDDPRITVIKVESAKGYYWDTKHGLAVAFAKRLVGSVIGKTLDDSIEGTLKS